MYPLHDLGRGRRHRHLRRLGQSSRRLGTTCARGEAVVAPTRYRRSPGPVVRRRPLAACISRSSARRHRVLLDEAHVLGGLIAGDVLAAGFLRGGAGRRVRPRSRGDQQQRRGGAKNQSSLTTGAQMALFGNFVGLAYRPRARSLPSDAASFLRAREAQHTVFH